MTDGPITRRRRSVVVGTVVHLAFEAAALVVLTATMTIVAWIVILAH